MQVLNLLQSEKPSYILPLACHLLGRGFWGQGSCLLQPP